MKHFKTSIILLAFCLLGSSCRELDTINTLKKVGNNRYLYEMEYLADYDLDDVIASDIDSNGKLVRYVMNRLGIKKMPVDTAMSEVNCTSFQAKNADGPGYLFGRNFDMFKNPTMVLVSRPKNGYASISVQNMQFMGYSLEKLPKGIFSKLMALAAIYVPMDGMNEKGLCTSIMALPKQPAYQDSGKHKVGTTILMRLFLDRCATVPSWRGLTSATTGRSGAATTIWSQTHPGNARSSNSTRRTVGRRWSSGKRKVPKVWW